MFPAVVSPRSLERRGVVFHTYHLPDLKTTDHVAVMGTEKAAWFADTEGNILRLRETTDASSLR